MTATLLALGLDVVAVEPDHAMLAQLRRSLPTAWARPGSAESIPLPDGSEDAVLAGNAMHWFDMDVAGPEIPWVLAPDCVLAGLWNLVDDQVDWLAGLAQVSGPFAIGPRDTPASWRTEIAAMHLPRSGGPARFGSPERLEVPHGQRRDAHSLVATLATRAGMLTMPHAEPRPSLVGYAPFSRAAQRRLNGSSLFRC